MISKKLIVQEDITLNTESTIAFLSKIEQAYPFKKKIHLFCDNARYYRNKRVSEYLAKSKISLHFLPPYSPNLNPIERLWKWMKERVIYNTYYEYFDDFKLAVLGFLEQISRFKTGTYFWQELSRKVSDRFMPINGFTVRGCNEI